MDYVEFEVGPFTVLFRKNNVGKTNVLEAIYNVLAPHDLLVRDPGESAARGVLAYLRYEEQHPHGAWAAYVGMGRSDPVLRGIEDVDNDRQADRILGRMHDALGDELDSKVERDVRIIVYGWLPFTFEVYRRRLIDPSLDAGQMADACAHALLDAIGRVPSIPATLREAVAPEHH